MTPVPLQTVELGAGTAVAVDIAPRALATLV